MTCVCVPSHLKLKYLLDIIGGSVVRVFANHVRGLGFNPRDKRTLISNNYFQFIKIECDLIRVRTSNLLHAKQAR
jgi:hypothetical protein